MQPALIVHLVWGLGITVLEIATEVSQLGESDVVRAENETKRSRLQYGLR